MNKDKNNNNRYSITFILHDKETKQDIFLYGISLPTEAGIKEFEFPKNEDETFFLKKEKISRYKELVIFRNITPDYQILDNINITNIINDKRIKNENKEDLTFNILNKQEIIQTYSDYKNESPESILKLPIRTNIYHTNSFFDYYKDLEKNYSEITKILNFLKENTGLSFIDNRESLYSKRLGCFEYITEVPDFVEERNEIFLVEQEFCDDDKRNEKFYFQKLKKYNKPLSVILTIYNDLNDIIFCQKKEIKSKISTKEKIFFDKSLPREYIASMKYQIFNDEGKIIGDYKCSFIKSINVNMHVLESKPIIKIDNALYHKKSIYNGTGQNIIKPSGNKSSMEINYDKELNERWVLVYNKIRNFYDKWIDYLKSNKEDTGIFINNNILNKAELTTKLKKFFEKIVDNDDCILTIIDPYFGITFDDKDKKNTANTKDISNDKSNDNGIVSNDNKKNIIITANAFEAFYTLPLNTKLIVYSCLNLKAGFKKNSNAENIKKMFDNFKEYGVSIGNTEWFDFIEANKFHDRYIKVENIVTKKVKLYLVSNSFNNLLIKYPLCISELFGNTKENALNYIDNLEQDNEKIDIFKIK